MGGKIRENWSKVKTIRCPLPIIGGFFSLMLCRHEKPRKIFPSCHLNYFPFQHPLEQSWHCSFCLVTVQFVRWVFWGIREVGESSPSVYNKSRGRRAWGSVSAVNASVRLRFLGSAALCHQLADVGNYRQIRRMTFCQTLMWNGHTEPGTCYDAHARLRRWPWSS